MKLFRLLADEADNDVAEERYDWCRFVDVYEFSVLAPNEAAARQIAFEAEFCGGPMWLDPEAVTCVEVPLSQPGIVTKAEGTG